MSSAGLAPPRESVAHSSYTSTRRFFRVLDHVSHEGGRITAKGLARELGVSIWTCYHLIGILIDEGYLEKLPHRGGYRLGPTIAVLSARARRSERPPVVDRVLLELARAADRPAYFAVLLESKDVMVTHVHSPPGGCLIGVPEGFCGPSHALAFGKVLIADGGSAAIDRYIHRYELRAFTERTITDPVRLEAHLKAVSRCGYALDQEEFAKNLYFVAVGVRDAGGAVCGSVALATLSSSPPPDLPRMIGLARCGADRISQGLCGEPRPHVPVALR